jgi:GR25 family glycosyltransferase involved in LPS biosynthesis
MIDKIYLLHHRDFTERFNIISKRLKEEDTKYEIIDTFSPSEIDYDNLMINYESFTPTLIEHINDSSYYNFSKKISPGSLSLVLKHVQAWKNQLENNYENILVLEDDCEIPLNFNQYIESIINEHKQDNKCELIMVGTCLGFVSPSYLSNGKHIFYHPYQKTRCTHGYIISKKCAQKMIDGFKNFNLPIDFKMNEVIQLENINVGWVEPGLRQIG